MEIVDEYSQGVFTSGFGFDISHIVNRGHDAVYHISCTGLMTDMGDFIANHRGDSVLACTAFKHY